jgi:hypothetical protein
MGKSALLCLKNSIIEPNRKYKNKKQKKLVIFFIFEVNNYCWGLSLCPECQKTYILCWGRVWIMQHLIMQFSLARDVQSLLRKHLFNTVSCKNTDLQEKRGRFRKASLVLKRGIGSTWADTLTVRPCHLPSEWPPPLFLIRWQLCWVVQANWSKNKRKKAHPCQICTPVV